jgi:hypothetical protein
MNDDNSVLAHCDWPAAYKEAPDWREFGYHSGENPDWPLVAAGYKLSEDTVDHRHYDRCDDWWVVTAGFFAELPEPERVVHIPHEEPYTDLRVRWAVAYAVDQEQLVEVSYTGAGKSSAHFCPEYPGLLAYVESIGDILAEYNLLEVNLEKSADLMIEVGFEKDGEGFWVKDGRRPDCDIWAGVPLFGDIAPITAEPLCSVGFGSMHVTPPERWVGKDDGRAILHFFGHGGSVEDPFTTLDIHRIRN